ncbi:hypothetical protein ACH4NS_08275 [Streptomyces mutabilis]|uniref:hypothetical protein n=1 Tax=Streptomyces mutabilis TaxID=67332 RepID=UPI0037B5AC69
MVKNHSRKRDVRRRQEETGEGYQTALEVVRRIQAVTTARQAAIAGEREIVDQLITEWLCLPLSEQWRDAVEMALMDGALSPDRIDESCLGLLRTLARAERLRLAPLWMRRALGGRLVLLSEQTGIDATDHQSPEAVLLNSEFDDERLSFVLGGLTEQERRLVQIWAGLGGSWGEAASSQGLDVKAGERVRRKVRRLGAEQIRRAEAVAR